MSGPFKMNGFPAHAGVSPMKKDLQDRLKKQGKHYKKTTKSKIYNPDYSHKENVKSETVQDYVDYSRGEKDKYGNVIKKEE